MRTTALLLLLTAGFSLAACSDSPGSGSAGPDASLDVTEPDAGVDATDSGIGAGDAEEDLAEDIGGDASPDASEDTAPDVPLTCEDLECDDNATCSEGESGPLCVCDAGYEGDGFECTDIDECLEDPCDANASCENTPGSFTCTCEDGFTGDGFFCVEGDPCEDIECGDNESCVVSEEGASCECSEGYERVDEACQDVDECLDSPCDELASCTNTDGGFSCECPDGYSGDGFECTDIDECAEGLAECALFCTNVPGSYVCPCVPPNRDRGDGCEPPRILVYGFPDDGQLLVDAVEAKGWTAIQAVSGSEFDTRFDEGGFDAIIIDTLADALNRSGNQRVIRWVDAGGPLIIGTWNLDFWEDLASAVGATGVTSFGEVRPVFATRESGMDLFAQHHSIPDFPVWEDTFGNNGVTFDVPGGVVLATFDVADGPSPAIGITNGRRVIINGFMPGEMTLVEEEYDQDGDGVQDNQELIENELDLILMPWLHVRSDMSGHPLAAAARLAGIPVIESDDTTYMEIRAAWDFELHAYDTWSEGTPTDEATDIRSQLAAGVPQLLGTPDLYGEADVATLLELDEATPVDTAPAAALHRDALFNPFSFIFDEVGTLPFDSSTDGPGYVSMTATNSLPVFEESSTGETIGVIHPATAAFVSGTWLGGADTVDNDDDGLLSVDEVLANIVLGLAQGSPRPPAPELEPLDETDE